MKSIKQDVTMHSSIFHTQETRGLVGRKQGNHKIFPSCELHDIIFSHGRKKCKNQERLKNNFYTKKRNVLQHALDNSVWAVDFGELRKVGDSSVTLVKVKRRSGKREKF